MDTAKIQERIDLYKRQREALIDEANRKIAELAGAIAALEQLIADSASDVSSTENKEGDA